MDYTEGEEGNGYRRFERQVVDKIVKIIFILKFKFDFVFFVFLFITN